MKALVDPRDGRVAQLAEKSFPVAPPLFWRQAPAGVTTHHTWNGIRFIPPAPHEPEAPGPDLAERLALRLRDKGMLTEQDIDEIGAGRRGNAPRRA